MKLDCHIGLNAWDLIKALNLLVFYLNLLINYRIGSNFRQILKCKKYYLNFLSYYAAKINALFENFFKALLKNLKNFYWAIIFKYLESVKIVSAMLRFYYRDVSLLNFLLL